MKPTRFALCVPALLAIALAAAAQPAPGASAPRGMQRMGPDNTPGWSMMTRDERREHEHKMGGMMSHGDCMAHMEQHHARMTERAKARGMAAPGKARQDACSPLAGKR